MTINLLCYRCGASLASLTLPFSRYDECPSCSMHLRVCRMCQFYDPDVPRKCREDDAEEVTEKERLNFCEWFQPGCDLFDGKAAKEEAKARDSLASLFGDADDAKTEDDSLHRDADDLFR